MKKNTFVDAYNTCLPVLTEWHFLCMGSEEIISCCMDFRVPFSLDVFLHTTSSPNYWPLVELWVDLVRHQGPSAQVTEHLSDQTGLPRSYKVACSPAQK